jgi:hypothetical protein
MTYRVEWRRHVVWDLPPAPPRNERLQKLLAAALEARTIAGVETCSGCDGLGSVLHEYEFIEPEYKDCPVCIAAGYVPIEHTPEPPEFCMGEDRHALRMVRR